MITIPIGSRVEHRTSGMRGTVIAELDDNQLQVQTDKPWGDKHFTTLVAAPEELILLPE